MKQKNLTLAKNDGEKHKEIFTEKTILLIIVTTQCIANF